MPPPTTGFRRTTPLGVFSCPATGATNRHARKGRGEIPGLLFVRHSLRLKAHFQFGTTDRSPARRALTARVDYVTLGRSLNGVDRCTRHTFIAPEMGSNTVLYRAIYISQCLIPPEADVFSTAIRSILNYSRAWNASNATTGVLYCNAKYFAQVLEGPRDVLQATLGHIMCDERNHNPELLEFRPTAHRDFEGWSMAYVDGTTGPDIPLTHLIRAPITYESQSIIKLLRWLVESPRGGG